MSRTLENAAVCWVVTDGRAGNEGQALGLAEAIARRTALTIVAKRIPVGELWRRLPRFLWGDPLGRLGRQGDQLSAPFPDLWIGCGKLAVPLTIAVKRNNPSTFTIQIQDPRARLSLFDLVVAPAHDRLRGDNVISMLGAPNRLEGETAAAVARTGSQRVAVLVGGSNRAFRFTERDAGRLGGELRKLAESGATLAVTTSRRTPAPATEALRKSLEGTSASVWTAGADDPARNPYPGMLNEADAVFVTEDSVNMAAEAATTGRPVYILPLTRKPFGSTRKFDAFHEALRARGAARRFDGAIERWTYKPLRETGRVADEIVRRWRTSRSRVR